MGIRYDTYNFYFQGSYLTWKTWKIDHFYEKSGKTWKSQGIFYDFYPSQGKVRENKLFSQNIILINYWHGCSQSRCSNCCQ